MTDKELKDVNEALDNIGIENVQNIIIITNEATNGDMIKAMFPDLRVEETAGPIYAHYPNYIASGGWIYFDREWWDAPCKLTQTLGDANQSGLDYADMPTV